jgi:hypothetical protein
MKILDFLADLATDAELMSTFRSAPRAVLSARGFNEQEQSLLLCGDPVAVRKAVAAEADARRAAGQWAERSPGPPSMELWPPKPDPAPHPPGPMPEEWPPPEKPRPEEFPPPAMPEEWPPPGKSEAFSPTLMEEFPRPDEPEEPEEPEVTSESEVMLEEFPRPDEPEEPEGPEEVEAHEAESLSAEPLDFEFDLAPDAVFAGMRAARSAAKDPAGVWSVRGLTVVGMGMRAGLHMTVETRLAIQQTKRVLYLVADPVSEACIRKLNPAAEPLGHLYKTGMPRIEIYETIIARILGELESAGDLCVAFYGHPGVLTYPAWESIRRARATGKQARMLPAISTEDSLFADLGIDIGRAGLQSFEATRFLYSSYNFDPSAGLLLWQVSVLGENEWNPPHTGVRPRLEVLAKYLQKFYPPEHEVFLYHAPEYPTSRALIEQVALRDLARAEFVSISTLYVPPVGKPPRNEENLRALARVTARK